MVIGYLRVSTGGQTTENQQLAIFKAGYNPDQWFEINGSATLPFQKRKIDELLDTTTAGDTIVVTELSRLGRSVGQIATIVDELLQKKVILHCLKENIRLDGSGKMDLQTETMTTLFSLFASIERRLISERTKEGIERARKAGSKIGRPNGMGKSKLDDRRQEIEEWAAKGISKASIAKLLGVGYSTVNYYMTTRGILRG